jgi:hypothetical protein
LRRICGAGLQASGGIVVPFMLAIYRDKQACMNVAVSKKAPARNFPAIIDRYGVAHPQVGSGHDKRVQVWVAARIPR